MNLFQTLTRSTVESRYSLDEFAQDVSSFYYSGLAYSGVQQTYDKRPSEGTEADFPNRVRGIYKQNGVVFACQAARLLLFTEARFMWQQMRAGRPGDRFWTPELGLLERPWVNGSTGELLARMIQDVDLAGNAYIRRTSPLAEPRLERLRPDWTVIILGTNSDLLNAEVVGYGYQDGGFSSDEDPVFLSRDEVAHWAPIPDPAATYRGMSWLSTVLREVRGDTLATDHKNQFFSHAATPNMVIKFDPSVPFEKFEKFKAAMDVEHAGVQNAYRTMFLGGGADATVVGTTFQQMDFKAVQGAGETRIAAAAGVPPVIVGLSEGLAAATYSNYAQARRRFADMTIRPLWRSACAALETVAPAPERARLWFDDRDIPALQEDQKDAAEIQSVKAQTIASLVREGFTPESVVAAVESEDMSLLSHTGALSVQLVKPGADNPDDEPAELPAA